MKIHNFINDQIEEIEIIFNNEVWSKKGLPCIGATWNYIKSSKIGRLTLNFENTYWIEVSTLLALTTLANQMASKTELIVHFGELPLNASTRIQTHDREQEKKLKFLSFLRAMGFFLALPNDTIIRAIDASETEPKTSIVFNAVGFENFLNGFQSQPFIQAITLIPLQVRNVSEFVSDQNTMKFDPKKLKAALKHVAENAALNIASAGFHRGTISRQRILLSIDKLLQESLANVIEHAYLESSEDNFLAFYARVRNPNSSFGDEFKNGLYDALDEFSHSKDVNWTELYVCDLGVGLETQIKPWLDAEEAKEIKDFALIKQLTDAENSSNKFLRASRLLFDNSLSRHLDRDNSRSPQTGFQDLKRVLADVGYVDISNCVAVNRRRFHNTADESNNPLRANFIESRTPHLMKDKEKHELLSQFLNYPAELTINAGTHLTYRTQFSSELPISGQPGFKNIGRKQASEVLNVYKDDTQPFKNHICFDKRFSGSSQPSNDDFEHLLNAIEIQRSGSHVSLFIRLSRNPYKNDVNGWFRLNDHSIYGETLNRKVHAKNISMELHFVDVLPVYAGWLVERIKSVAKSGWILGSRLTQIGVFTNLLFFVIFEREETQYRISKRNASEHSTAIRCMIICLREMDSQAFWNEYEGHSVEEMYLNEQIEWVVTKRKLGEVFTNEYPKIWGYLDFANGLQCLERFRVCERSLLRFMAILYSLNDYESLKSELVKKLFLPTLVSSDNLTQRLVSSVNALFEEIAEFNENSHLVLSSIVISGQTKDRASLGISKPTNQKSDVDVSFFDRTKNQKKNGGKDFALMRWAPPKKSDGPDKTLHKRIFRTPEVSPHGALDIKIPHVVKRNGEKVENYQRDRTETYADFELLGALQFGHFAKSNRHELINLNLNALVPLIISTSHPSWNWLVSSFFDKARDSDNEIVVIYPNQPHAEQIIQELKHRESSKVPFDQVAFISAPFLKPRKTEPIIVSPRLELRLAELIHTLRSQRSSPSKSETKPIIIRIFDAGVVTGRTIRALEQQIESVFEVHNNKNVGDIAPIKFETISLVDRSGQPIYGSLLSKYSQNNKRYWRWDVPSLTENGTCRICLAQQKILELSKIGSKTTGVRQWNKPIPSLLSFAATDQIERDGDKDETELWHDNLSDIQISALPAKYQKVIFGYYDTEPNHVYLASALQYISTFAELTRLLHRSDITLNRAMELVNSETGEGSNIDCLSILLISSHLLLFYETFDKFEKVNYAVELFGCLIDFEAEWNERNVRTLSNRYGILALYAIEPEVLEILKGPSFFCDWLSKKNIKNPYLNTFIDQISSGNTAFPTAVDMGEKAGEIWKSNNLLLRKNCSIIVDKIMDIVGDQRLWHKSEINKRLARGAVNHSALQNEFRSLFDLVNEAHELGLFECNPDVLDTLKCQANAETSNALSNEEKNHLIEILDRGGSSLRASLFDAIIYLGAPASESAAWSDRRKVKSILTLFLSAQDGSYDDFIDQLNLATKNTSNAQTVNELLDYVGLATIESQLPFDGSVSLVPSAAAKTVVENALLNSRHATRKIRNPTTSKSPGEGRRFVWIWISREDDALVLNFANHCETKFERDSLYQDRFPSFFLEGNDTQIEYDRHNKILTTKLIFHTLVRR